MLQRFFHCTWERMALRPSEDRELSRDVRGEVKGSCWIQPGGSMRIKNCRKTVFFTGLCFLGWIRILDFLQLNRRIIAPHSHGVLQLLVVLGQCISYHQMSGYPSDLRRLQDLLNTSDVHRCSLFTQHRVLSHQSYNDLASVMCTAFIRISPLKAGFK